MSPRPTDSSLYQCFLCTFVGIDASTLRRHFEQEHHRNNFFWCKWCGKASSCSEEYIGHLEKESCDTFYNHPCGFAGCDFSDRQPTRFISHLKTSHKREPLIPCKYCKRLFTMPACLITHLQEECCNRPMHTSLKEQPLQKTTDENSKSLQDGHKPDSSRTNPTTSLKPQKSKADENKTLSSTDCNNNKQKQVGKSVSSKTGKSRGKPPKAMCKNNTLFGSREGEHSDSDVDDPTYNPAEQDSHSDTDKRKGKQSKVSKTDSAVSRKRKVLEVCKKSAKRKKQIDDANNDLECNRDDEEPEWNSWEEWLKRLHSLKAPEALDEQVKSENIKNFFKCMHRSCTFSSQDKMEFALHVLNTDHSKEPHRCNYCFQRFTYIEVFLKHLIVNHGKRKWQCSTCFYRSSTKTHAKLHKQVAHGEEEIQVLSCKHLDMNGYENNNLVTDEDGCEERNAYNCFMSTCNFNTLITDEFESHFAEKHPKTKIYSCCYCDYDSEDLKLLIDHFREHDIHNFECYYCSFGSENSQEVLTHICINHADLKMQILSRSTKSNVSEASTGSSVQSPSEKSCASESNSSVSTVNQEESNKRTFKRNCTETLIQDGANSQKSTALSNRDENEKSPCKKGSNENNDTMQQEASKKSKDNQNLIVDNGEASITTSRPKTDSNSGFSAYKQKRVSEDKDSVFIITDEDDKVKQPLSEYKKCLKRLSVKVSDFRRNT